MHKLYLIGSGNVATHFARFFTQKHIPFIWFKPEEKKRYFNSEDERAEPTLYLCAVDEPNLVSLLDQFQGINSDSYYGHLSGSKGMDVFPETIRKRGFVCHPMQTFPNKTDVISLEECTYVFQGEIYIYNALNHAVHHQLHIIQKEIISPEAYHLMGVFASNFLPALVSICVKLGTENGFTEAESKRLILPLMKQTLANIEGTSLVNALSGPLKRGATDVIKKHEDYLKSQSDDLKGLYQQLNSVLKENILNEKK